MVKSLPASASAGDKETQVQSLGGGDPLEKGVVTHASFRAWEIQWTEEPGGPLSMRLHRVVHY